MLFQVLKPGTPLQKELKPLLADRDLTIVPLETVRAARRASLAQREAEDA